MTSSTASSTRARMMLATAAAPRPAGFGSWPGGGRGVRSVSPPGYQNHPFRQKLLAGFPSNSPACVEGSYLSGCLSTQL